MFDIQKLKNQLIVSCQPDKDEAFYTTDFAVGMAQAAALGGAGGLRLNGPATVKAVKAVLDLPVIGIWKQIHAGSDVYITPTLAAAQAMIESGIEILALDATPRQRPTESLSQLIQIIKGRVCLMADISTLEEALSAQELGFDCVGTTLAGYTSYSSHQSGPDYELLQAIVATFSIPVIMEGRIWTPEQARQALDSGAHAVVVGSAITRPQLITQRYIQEMRD